jgi:predicted GNAT family acetyltransferase
MRLISNLFKLILLTSLCYGAFIVYEEVNLFLHTLDLDEQGIISPQYQIDYKDNQGKSTYSPSTFKKEEVNPDQDVKKQPSKAELRDRYQFAFENFYEQVQKKVSDLMQVAYEEYIEKKESGEDISYFYFFTKYNRAAKNLEEATDEAFYDIYEAFVADLKKHGYDTAVAEEYLSQYENKKSVIRTSIIKEAASAF